MKSVSSSPSITRSILWLCSAIALFAASTGYAVIPGMLPNKNDVPQTERSPIDGDWMISVNNKRIRIESGRAYALDTWLHALIWTIQPDMVVLQNIETMGNGLFEADDLPLLGRARIQQLDSGELDVTVSTALGPVNYQLQPLQLVQPEPVDVAYDDVDVIEPVFESSSEEEAPVAWEPDAETAQRTTPTSEQAPPQMPPVRPSRQVQPPPPEFLTYDVFTGCQPDQPDGPSSVNPRERIEARVDRVTQRQFAGFTLDEARASTDDDKQLGTCWMRLDGVWQENRNISLDRSKDQPDIWGTDSPELIVLANGNYTDPGHLFIGSVGRDDREIWVSDGLSANGFVQFVSDDGLSLDETLVENGPTKLYAAKGSTYLGETLRVDLTASKRARLRLDNVTYLRPTLELSEAAMQDQMASNDAFLLQANLENLVASRRGYDAVKQDPFFLLNNKKMAVFAEFDPKRYYITEQRIIPVGYKFVQNGVQGMIYNKSMTTTAREYQDSISTSLGATLEGKTDPAGFGGNASVSVDASASWLQRMEESKHVAQAIGYSRAKKYALVLDHPFVTLSDDFIDAIDDARETGSYDNIIRQFGTHYPYAVTYGAAAKISQSVTEERFKKLTEWNAGVSASMAGGALGQNGSVRGSINAGSVNGNSGSLGTEDTTFVAVGGNGSWNENGYSLGPTPYPILLDLRPLHELLNHLNFPDQPDVYTKVRAGLKDTLEDYIQSHASDVSDRSLLPAIEPKKLETWHLYVREVWCTGKGAILAHGATGKLEMEAFMGNRSKGYLTTPHKNFEAKCKKKKEVVKHSYKKSSPGLIEITGTREQIAAYAMQLRLQWRYTPSNRNKWRNHNKTFVGISALKNGLGRGKSKDQIWKVGSKGKPDFTFRVRAKRIR
jgi:MAC/Perforin domain-containing protein